jgi:hypothetical protein
MIEPGTGYAKFYLARDVAIIESKRELSLH